MIELVIIAMCVEEPRVPDIYGAIHLIEQFVQKAEAVPVYPADEIRIFPSVARNNRSVSAHSILTENHGSLGHLIATSAGGNPY